MALYEKEVYLNSGFSYHVKYIFLSGVLSVVAKFSETRITYHWGSVQTRICPINLGQASLNSLIPY